jgi:hypothetical protein
MDEELWIPSLERSDGAEVPLVLAGVGGERGLMIRVAYAEVGVRDEWDGKGI